MSTVYLILENGSVFKGCSFGAKGEAVGEVVFTTGMTGHIESLTDPNNYGQIVTHTFPLLGNYGVIPDDFESNCNSAIGCIVKHQCQEPSNFRSEGTLDAFLKSRNIIGICGIDTRKLTKIIRENGTMNAMITDTIPENFDMNLYITIDRLKLHKLSNAVDAVSTKEKYTINDGGKYRIALLDLGVKNSLKKALIQHDCAVTVYPFDTPPQEILAENPNGIVISGGPGDPADCKDIQDNIKMMTGVPILGIGLGHQLLAAANRFKTTKMRHGHRGSNQPSKDLMSGKVHIVKQNHSYTVEFEKTDRAEQWFKNVNDGSCDGIIYNDMPAMSVQFHPNDYVIGEFVGKICGTHPRAYRPK
ncbi:MAG: carbamoyl phosphate synthase small subunit [Oscillospiraceae bacterium]|nr:carbamoyl phosphate synthase small subunit [Oscillospiraceae bacterium]